LGLLVAPLLAHSSSHDSADSYVLRLGDITYMNGKGMTGDALKRLQEGYGPRFFWFTRAGHTYVVKAGQEIERAEAIVAPQDQVSTQMEKRLGLLADQCIRSGAAKAVAR